MTPRSLGSVSSGPFAHRRYSIRCPWFSFLGRKLYVHGPDGEVLLFVRHKLLTFRDEWAVFTDETERVPLLRVKARKALALDSVSDVTDARTGASLGAVRVRGLKSMVRDTFELLGPGDAPVGIFVEDSNALLRRFFPLMLGHWHMEFRGRTAARLDQVWRWFAREFTLELDAGEAEVPFVLACALLALSREMMRESS
jgi:hypothetical protein